MRAAPTPVLLTLLPAIMEAPVSTRTAPEHTPAPVLHTGQATTVMRTATPAGTSRAVTTPSAGSTTTPQSISARRDTQVRHHFELLKLC